MISCQPAANDNRLIMNCVSNGIGRTDIPEFLELFNVIPNPHHSSESWNPVMSVIPIARLDSRLRGNDKTLVILQ